MTQFKDIQRLAAKLGIEVEKLPGDWCRLAMPSRINPTRRMPPLMLSTAKETLDDELQEAKPIAAE